MSFRLKIIDMIGGSCVDKWYRFLQKSQYWNIEQQKQYQEKKLKQLIEHAYYNVPYYSKLLQTLKLKPSDFNTIDDLQKIPLLTREDLKNNFDLLIAKNHNSFKPQKRRTGGTTGIPTSYLSDINSWSMHWALKYRAWKWGNAQPGEKVAIFGGASVIPNEKPTIARKVWNKLNNFYTFPSTHLNDEIMMKYSSLIQSKKIHHLRGYPSSIAIFADFCKRKKIELNINSIITTAEVLLPHYKDLLYEVFNPIIIDTYGCADGGGNANTCKYDKGFHVSTESAIWEVTDQNGIISPINSHGEITLTSLTNYSMPTIRYQPGDIIENNFDFSTCECGCKLPRIKRIEGRTTDTLIFPNGNSISGPALTVLMSKFPLMKYQITQNQHNALTITIIPNQDFSEQNKSEILNLFSHHCGKDVHCKINITDAIPIPSSGKHRFIINNSKNGNTNT